MQNVTEVSFLLKVETYVKLSFLCNKTYYMMERSKTLSSILKSTLLLNALSDFIIGSLPKYVIEVKTMAFVNRYLTVTRIER
jgi:hypothetical protein